MNGAGTTLFEQHAAARSQPGLRRVMLDWSEPLLAGAARWLMEHRAQQGNSSFATRCVDLRRTMCVLPGARAGRLLLEELLHQCDRDDAALLPPLITTPGRGVDELLRSVVSDDDIDTRVADDWTVELAWTEALRRSDADILRPVTSQLPERDDWPAWQRLARTIANLHETLAGARCSFSDVAPRAEAMEKFPEGDRWRALAGLHEQYISILASRGMVDPQQRREQLLQQFEKASHGDALAAVPVLIGVVELNALQRDTFSAAAKRNEMCVLAHAPESFADRFDELGCVRSGAWDDVFIDDARATVIVADRPMDQAQRVIEAIAGLDGTYHADEVVIGLGDATLSGAMHRSASWAGAQVHDAAGFSMARSPVYSVLKLCAQWLRHERFADFAALLRHPHIERRLDRRAGAGDFARAAERWATLLDRYYSDHLQGQFTGEWLGDDKTRAQLARVYHGVQSLLAPLRGNARPLRDWGEALINVLRELYQDIDRAGDREQWMHVRDAADVVIAMASELERSDELLQPTVDGAEAVQLILSRCADAAVAQPIDERAIEMLGWLELHADPAAALIIAGFNEGAIPSSICVDPFLPNDLRACLGLPNNISRFARDAYLIAAAQQSRASLTIIAGRRAANDEPLTPSRLLLQGDDELLLKRASLLCDESDHAPAEAPIGLAQPPMNTLFITPPLPGDYPAVAFMRVTDFKAYLDCPYRFALRRLRFERQTDGARELDPPRFGSLLHHALSLFGGDPSLRDLTDAKPIADAAIDILNELAKRHFGHRPLPAVRIQLAMLHRRLLGFAEAQAKQRAEGWTIRHVEYDIRENAALDILGQDPMPLRGRIDRIDFNDRLNRWRVIDYKSSEDAKTPCETHHKERKTLPKDDELAWSDLQLPLYDSIIRQAGLGIGGSVELCYFNVPRASDHAGVCAAPWQANHLAHGIDTAREIVRAIRRGEFEPNPDAGGPYDDFARLCHNEFLSAMGYDETEADE